VVVINHDAFFAVVAMSGSWWFPNLTIWADYLLGSVCIKILQRLFVLLQIAGIPKPAPEKQKNVEHNVEEKREH
jgi:hypothetical protein